VGVTVGATVRGGDHQVVADFEESQRSATRFTRDPTGGVKENETADCWMVDGDAVTLQILACMRRRGRAGAVDRAFFDVLHASESTNQPAITRRTLRFRKSATHTRLKRVSDLVGSSMNEIAEAAIERELDFLAADLEQELLETVEALRGWEYTRSHLERDIAAFADGEAFERDPLRSTLLTVADSAGVGDIFAGPVDR